ncbi:hypothetical protein AAG570_007676 [Ranatra chinensis]|uniref:Uncharacterized protein n=1 Tax=Ranatra chinensis TaxID=642074 RepID=A0ABD0XVI5_9HEMI
MESGRGSGGGLRTGAGSGKKMRKRKELDALVGGVSGGSKRRCGGSGRGVSPQDQLLSESTGEEEYWTTKGMKPRRRYNSRGDHHDVRPFSALLRICSLLLMMACLVATLTLMWLFIDIREQTTYLHNRLDQVAAGSQGVPDALQKCHSLSRQLQNNQTLLFTQLSSLSQHLTKFTAQVSILQTGLSNVEDKLSSSPELVNVPHDMQALSASVASIGSQIQDLQTTSNRLKEEHNTLLETVKILQQNASTLNVSSCF